jgi:hypothetical protein
VIPHDVPTAAELVEAVREWIDALGDRPANRFHARVASNVMKIVERELELGPEQAIAHAERLERLGVADDAALATAIRDGSIDHRSAEVRDLVWASVRDKLAVANPGYLTRVERD